MISNDFPDILSIFAGDKSNHEDSNYRLLGEYFCFLRRLSLVLCCLIFWFFVFRSLVLYFLFSVSTHFGLWRRFHVTFVLYFPYYVSIYWEGVLRLNSFGGPHATRMNVLQSSLGTHPMQAFVRSDFNEPTHWMDLQNYNSWQQCFLHARVKE